MEKMKQLFGILIAIGVVVGLRLHGKSSDHDDLKAKLVILCAKDEACLSAVNTHYDACFDSNYDMGGRRRGAGLKTDAFLGCFNQRAGAEVFAVKQTQQPEQLAH